MRAIAAAAALLLLGGGAHAQDAAGPDLCAKLRALHVQYKGVKLDAQQEADKVQMTAFYNANCRKRWKRR